jgi:hypothetical protein
MRKAGAFILVVGIIITIFTGVNSLSNQDAAEISHVDVTSNSHRELGWSSVWGMGMIIVGGCIFLFGLKKQTG